MRSVPIHSYASVMITLSSLLFPAVHSRVIARNTTDTAEQLDFDQISPSPQLVWHPCLSTYFCAMLDVPLDYSEPNGLRAAVPLIKIPAETNSRHGEYQGMLLTNPGGPGESGVNFVLTTSSVLQSVIGTNFDIVSFDPRGMGHSIPSGNCSSSGSSGLRRRAFGISGPELPDAYWVETFADAMQLGQECGAAIGGPNGAGPHMSTAVVARDMLSIVDAFAATPSGKCVKEASLLNYWGISYGTFIGETFVSMYPDRVGRVVLDGVVDPEDYSSGANLSDGPETDAAMAIFFTYCHLAGPTLCPFYTGNSPGDIQARFENILDQLNATYAFSQNWTNATLLTQSLAQIKSTVRLNMYNPITDFPPMAQQLVAYEAALQNLTIESITAASTVGIPPTPNIPGLEVELEEWLPAVVCSDSPSFYNQTYAELEPYIAQLEQQSVIGGEVWASIKVLCTGWPISAKWRYAGPFGGTSRNPILFVSNTVDPATPIANSQKWSPRYAGSQILTIESAGHTSLAAENSCANAKIGAFFQTGKLPRHATCALEKGPFGLTPSGKGFDGLVV